jgi:ubiquinone/menaquinone biosynthesis C-methylase UbiE
MSHIIAFLWTLGIIQAMKQTGSFNSSFEWYSKLVGEKGHYYHEHLALPAAYRLLGLKPGNVLLDVGCGQGVVARTLPCPVEYWGADMAVSFITEARKRDLDKKHIYIVGDATKDWSIPRNHFTHALLMLSLQNMKEVPLVMRNISRALKPDGVLVMVMNHPCFRIPRQSGWTVNEGQ